MGIHEKTVEIVKAYVSNNQIGLDDVVKLIKDVQALVDGEAPAGEQKPVPAVPIEESIKDDYIICLEDGRKMKTMKRYLRIHYNMTPEEYRQKWGLPDDYPMVCPAFSRERRAIAKGMGLGTRKNSKAA